MSIKTYSHLHPSDHGLTFDLKRMEDIYAQREGRIDAPHRHSYYTVLLVGKGKGRHLIDFQEFYPERPTGLFYQSGSGTSIDRIGKNPLAMW